MDIASIRQTLNSSLALLKKVEAEQAKEHQLEAFSEEVREIDLTVARILEQSTLSEDPATEHQLALLVMGKIQSIVQGTTADVTDEHAGAMQRAFFQSLGELGATITRLDEELKNRVKKLDDNPTA